MFQRSGPLLIGLTFGAGRLVASVTALVLIFVLVLFDRPDVRHEYRFVSALFERVDHGKVLRARQFAARRLRHVLADEAARLTDD